MRRFLTCAVMVGAALLDAGSARAQVTQTDAAMTPLPQPVGEAERTLVTNSWGWSEDHRVRYDQNGNFVEQEMLTFKDFYPTFEDDDAITLQGLFKWRGETIDPVANASTGPGYFSPTCGFGGQLLLMGGNCQVSFGWYNILDPNSTTPPAPEEIYEFIPASTPELFQCLDQNGQEKTDGFCPLAWDNRGPTDLSMEAWQKLVFDSGNIKEDERYAGGYVGFALIGNPSKGCSESKFSLYNHNQRNADGVPWVATLIYQSTVDPEGFYMAFEDLPMPANDWTNGGKNDGDFNDFVFYVSGINCAGGGEPCTTNLQGACSLGRTDCAVTGEMPTCRPIVNPGAEICDNVDNDCNGVVDDGEGLCQTGFVCDKGACVGACGTGEFRCDPGFTCKTGFCIEDACANVMCEPGQACKNGECKDACQGTVCPAGQECQLGRCINPCAAIECPAGKVCEKGLCVSDCACRGCPEGAVCGDDGRCTDPACEGVTCDPGLTCQMGQCVDLCEGVVCPGGGVCTNGTCSDPVGTGGSGNTGTGGSIDIGGTLNLGGSLSAGGANNGTGGGSDGGNVKDPGCACSVLSEPRGPVGQLFWLGAAAAVGAFWMRRRRAA